jgi:rare lipoprotein A
MGHARIAALLLGMSSLAACGGPQGRAPQTASAPPECAACTTGLATWYGRGTRTANGERFDRNALTAAHRTLPLNSRVRVTNLENGQSVEVRITDRGPRAWTGRDIDLSEAAAREIGMLRSGVARVRIEPL